MLSFNLFGSIWKFNSQFDKDIWSTELLIQEVKADKFLEGGFQNSDDWLRHCREVTSIWLHVTFVRAVTEKYEKDIIFLISFMLKNRDCVWFKVNDL